MGLLPRVRHVLAAAASATLTALLVTSGCSSSTTPAAPGVPGEACAGGTGVVLEDGTCAPKCVPSACLPGNSCIDNECRLPCDALTDCRPETEECAEGVDDATGNKVLACRSNGRMRVREPLGTGTSCIFGQAQCEQTYCSPNETYPFLSVCDLTACGGNPAACIPDAANPTVGTCSGTADLCVPTLCDVSECKTALYCPNGLQCDPTPCGGTGTCDQDCEGGDCNIGKCSDTGLACVFNTCDPTHCRGLTCRTAGEGDADAYCSPDDCQTDSECGPGFHCGVTRAPQAICGGTCSGGSCDNANDTVVLDGPLRVANTGDITCGADRDCQKGNNPLCGITLDDCISEADFTAAGKTYQEGSLCLLRNSCLKSNECATCESDLDCSLGNGEICSASKGGNKSCARFCADQSDCRSDELCEPADHLTCAASPHYPCVTAEDCPLIADTCQIPTGLTDGTCSVTQTPCTSNVDCGPGIADACSMRQVCKPASGDCFGNPGGDDAFCHHCTNDTDCGDKDSTFACLAVSDGENGCVDLSFASTCQETNECPLSPSGDNAVCVTNENHALFGRCYLPFSTNEQGQGVRASCYPTLIEG